MPPRASAPHRPLRLLLAGTPTPHWPDAWKLIVASHPHWLVDVTPTAASARRYLDDHAVDAIVAGLTDPASGMAAVFEAARTINPRARRIAVVDSSSRAHPEARRASATVEASAGPASFLSELDSALGAA